MRNTFIDLTGKLPDTIFLPAFEQVGAAVALHGIAALVIGATARDLVMHYGHGATVRRATNDIDFGVQVTSWSGFQALRQHLVASGWRTHPHLQHRLTTLEGVPVDLVPFGGDMANGAGEISWPPAGEVVMSVSGFQEAMDHALRVRVSTSPLIEVSVASPAGIALLKLISWSERPSDVRRKDAKDLQYLMSQYEAIPAVMDRLYGEAADTLERYEFDPKIAGAWLLGSDVAVIAKGATGKYLSLLLADGVPGRSIDQLILEMSSGFGDDHELHEELMQAFRAGAMQGMPEIESSWRF
ncbi:MAG: nucleotidyl transferase AbiEii/AbiGii toxin family protein [Pseudomonadota bacterium]